MTDSFRIGVGAGIRRVYSSRVRTNPGLSERGFHIAFGISPDPVKGLQHGRCLLGLCEGWIGMTAPTPLGAMFHYPIGERLLETNIVAGFFRFDPFMLQDLLPLCLEFAVERRVLQQII